MELLVLGFFCILLLICITLDISILYALTAGWFLFALYGRKKGHVWKNLVEMSLDGIKAVKNILITFVLIGMLTAVWRAAGTVAVIVCYAVRFIWPSVFLLMAFLLNCFLSVLTGTAFGTAATMGVICTTMASALGVPAWMVGGAVLAGCYFGDRCSPVSTSALLVSELTGTEIFRNIRNMLWSAAVPFVLACAVYGVLGLNLGYEGELPDLQEIFKKEFCLSWIAVLPAVVLLALALRKKKVKVVMAFGILTAIPICLFIQRMSLMTILELLLYGYQAEDMQVASMMNGGGIFSMIKVGMIVCLSSSYSGLFRGTGLLDGICERIECIADKTTSFGAVLLTSLVTGVIACNQTLTIMLTHQLCGHTEKDSEKMALYLEDTAVVIAPLIPWSIAGAVPLATIGAPPVSAVMACFLYFLPIWGMLMATRSKYPHMMKK